MPSRQTFSLVTGTAMRWRTGLRLPVVGGSGAVEHERLRGFDVDDHLGQLAPHQRLVDQRVAERLPLPGVAQRLDQGPPGVAEREQRDAEPSRVGQLHHPAQALAVGRARVVARLTGQQEGLGVDELDLARGDRAGAELVLQPADPHAVAGAVATGPQHEEGRDAPARVGRALGLGQHDERLAVAVRREPLESVEQPRIAVARCRRLERAEIGAAGPLGEQLGGLPSHSPDSNLASTWSRTSAGAYAATNAFTMPPPVPSAQAIPMSAWLSR